MLVSVHTEQIFRFLKCEVPPHCLFADFRIEQCTVLFMLQANHCIRGLGAGTRDVGHFFHTDLRFFQLQVSSGHINNGQLLTANRKHI